MTVESNAVYSNGRLLFLRGDTLVSQPFDPDRRQLTGDAVALGVQVAKIAGEIGAFSVSDNGTLVYRAPGDAVPRRQILWMDRSGKTVKASEAEFQMTAGVKLSPSGRQVAFIEGLFADIFIYDLDRHIRTRLTTDPAVDHSPVWSPDGTRLIFDSHRAASDRPGGTDGADSGLYEKPANGATMERPLLDRESGVQHSPRDWSQDGRTLVFARQGENGRWNLWGLPLAGDRKPFPYRSGAFSENEASLSPNGRFLAFTSNESGRAEVIVQTFPDPSGGRWQISSEGGSAPRWRRDGRELYYLDPKGRLIALSVTTDRDFSIQQNTLTLQTPVSLPVQVGGMLFPYDVAPDGQRFLLAVPVAGLEATPLSVRVNWTQAPRK
jgi:Tol biopolymer transport system component